LDDVERAVDGLENARAGEMVDDLGACSAFGDDARALEAVEVARKGGQGAGGKGAQFVDAVVALVERVQDEDARGVGNGLENVGPGFGLFGIHICTFAQLCKCVNMKICWRQKIRKFHSVEKFLLPQKTQKDEPLAKLLSELLQESSQDSVVRILQCVGLNAVPRLFILNPEF
jgi:hypothetical protein